MPAARLTGYAFAAVAGLGCGVLGSFAHAYSASGLPLGLAAALGLLASVLWLSGVLTRSRGGVLVAAAGWLLVVLVLAAPRPEGDLIVPGTGLGYAWLFGGLLVVGVLVTRSYDASPGASPPPTGGALPGR